MMFIFMMFIFNSEVNKEIYIERGSDFRGDFN